MKYKLAVVITNRTNYSKQKLVLRALKEFSNVEIEIIASSSILLDRYGAAYHDLEADGLKVDVKLDCLLMNDSHEAMVNTIGLSMIQHSSYFSSFKPDMLLVVGDRFDAIAPAFSASIMNIPIAHIQGGEVSGSIDNKIRDVISKISTLHFVATDVSHARLVQFGMNEEHVFNYGCPAVEYIATMDIGDHFENNELHKKLKHSLDIAKGENFFLVMVHPDTTNQDDVDMNIMLEAITSFKMKTLIFYPNVDANNTAILNAINAFRHLDFVETIKHLPLEGFVHVMGHCACMIGNSSAGIREAASFGTPVVNVGDRQEGRERNSNVIDVRCEYTAIVDAIECGMNTPFEKTNIFYKEDCSKLITKEIVHYMEFEPAARES
jgi:UDP-hydrolysing UDP-N-acetyl-D-glucosamine 2-epimerase